MSKRSTDGKKERTMSALVGCEEPHKVLRRYWRFRSTGKLIESSVDEGIDRHEPEIKEMLRELGTGSCQEMNETMISHTRQVQAKVFKVTQHVSEDGTQGWLHAAILRRASDPENAVGCHTKDMRKIAAHQNTASDSITFTNTFPVDMRMKFGMTRQHVALCSTRPRPVTN